MSDNFGDIEDKEPLNMKIWTQWDDLKIPLGFTHLKTDGQLPKQGDVEAIQFYVPRYMGGREPLEIIPRMKSLQVVQSPNAGYDDVLQFLPHGVTLCNAAGVHDASTAELAVGLTIASRRGFAKFAQSQHVGLWEHSKERSLADSLVGVVGYGNIGRLIASQVSHFQAEVISFSRGGRDGSIPISDFDSYLPKLDVIILIVPLTAETQNFMNAKRISAMKDGATLVNVARGPVVDTEALVKELNTGRITAGLDVTDPEPLPQSHALWSAKNVIISPHVGGDTSAFEPRGKKLVEDQLLRLAEGKPLINIVA